MRNLFVGPLALVLSGCFASNAPLIAPADADHPFADGAAYVDYANCAKSPLLGCAGYKKTEWGTMRLQDGAYVLRPDPASNPALSLPAAQASKPVPVLFKKIGEGLYLAQATMDDSGEGLGYAYGVLKVEGAVAFAYNFQCEENGDKRYVQSGELDSISTELIAPTCKARSVAGLAKVFADRLQSGAEPDAKYEVK
jgi:hypothetical protein